VSAAEDEKGAPGVHPPAGRPIDPASEFSPSTQERATTPEAAKRYLELGYDPIPLGEKSKLPLGVKGNLPGDLRREMGLESFKPWEWSEQRITSESDVERYFHERTNVALALGERSGGLVDVDLDWPEAARIADELLADLPSFGRAGSPRSHRLAVCADAGTKVAFQLKPDQASLFGSVERREIVALRGNGHYTMVPPSVHPEGERVKADSHRDPPAARWEELERRCGLIAFLAVVVRKYPRSSGDRDNICMALAGALLAAGQGVDDADRLVRLVAELCGDEEAADRGKAAGTRAKMDADEHCTGLPDLCKRLEIEELENQLRAWLRLAAPASESTSRIPGRPVILADPGRLAEVVKEAEAALIEAAKPIYQRGAELVRPVLLDTSQDDGGIRRDRGSIVILPLNAPWLTLAMATVASFERSGRKNGQTVPADPVEKYANHLLASAGDWRFPVLRGVTTAPTLRADGSILQVPGYDAESQLIFDPCGVEFPTVPEHPTKEDAFAALRELDPLFAGFPFVDEHARSVVFSAILSGLLCRVLKAVPLHVFDAPAAGTGKSLLAETVGILVTGAKPPAMSQGKEEAEDEKRLSTVLRAGDQVILIDNIERPLSGDFLCSMLTQEVVQARILSRSERVVLPCNVLVMATGNNVVLAGDVTRRAVVCRMDAGAERPDQRQFDFDPRDVARDRRAEIVVACLTALRAYVVAGRPNAMPKVGSFEEWNVVREVLGWCGYGDPDATRTAILQEDPRRAELAEVLEAWRACFDDEELTLSELRERCVQDVGEHHRKLLTILMEARGLREWNSRSIGWWLTGNKDRVVGGLVLRKGGETRSGSAWRVVATDGRAAASKKAEKPRVF
jgi:hypothetical protein